MIYQGTDSAAAGTALILCKDLPTRALIVEALLPLAIRPETCDEVFHAVRLLETHKFEAVIVDLLLEEEALLLMGLLRLSRSNGTAVTFAIATEGVSINRAKIDTTFVLQRPLTQESVNQTLRAAYGLVVRERRRYFRCPIAIPAFVKVHEPSEFSCQTINISEGGVAINMPNMPESAVPAAVRFSLPERSGQFFAQTRICWRAQEGMLGLEFLSLPRPQKAELQEWLARKLDETLPENVATLFRSASPRSQ